LTITVIDRKSSSAQFEGRGRIRRKLPDLPRYRESFSIANNLCCYAVLVKASQNNVLPPPEAKGGNIFQAFSVAYGTESTMNF